MAVFLLKEKTNHVKIQSKQRWWETFSVKPAKKNVNILDKALKYLNRNNH